MRAIITSHHDNVIIADNGRDEISYPYDRSRDQLANHQDAAIHAIKFLYPHFKNKVYYQQQSDNQICWVFNCPDMGYLTIN